MHAETTLSGSCPAELGSRTHVLVILPANKLQIHPSTPANSTQCTDQGTGPHTDRPYSGHLTTFQP
jgi:hypothetical protein